LLTLLVEQRLPKNGLGHGGRRPKRSSVTRNGEPMMRQNE